MKKAFTLIELSIVLVIIGLVAGGVLAGKDLVEAARVRAAVSQIERLNVAANIFKGKYNALAGDMTNPDQFFSVGWNNVPITSLAGNGNGLLDWWPWHNAYTYLYVSEREKHFALLETAGLISENYNFGEGAGYTGNCGDATIPASRLGGRIGVFSNAITHTSTWDTVSTVTADAKNYYVLGIRMQWTDCNSMVSNGMLKPSQARALDLKMDDGNALTGRVRVTTGDGAWNNVIYDADPAHMRWATQTYGFGLCHLNDDGSYGADELAGQATFCTVKIRADW